MRDESEAELGTAEISQQASGLRYSSLSPHPSSLESLWALLVAVAAMALTMLPYLFGWSLRGARPALGWFSWLGYNLDDGCVYLSWMRQAADGHFFLHNLFTTEPQTGHQFYLFFWTLGTLARVLHLPLPFVWHAARLILGVAFLRAVWWLLELLLTDSRARRAAFLVVIFAAGLGWLPGLWQEVGHDATVDVWQPEAITFLSLYLNPLFIVSLLLMVGILGWLLIAERTRSTRPAIYAGLCGLLLGNIHAYDVITVACVWTAFLVVRAVVRRTFDAAAWGRALLAGAIAAPSALYLFYLARTERVFAQRIAVETASPPLRLYLLGYGLVLLLALVGAWALLARRSMKKSEEHIDGDARSDKGESPARDHDAALLIVVWAVANLATAYLPVSFQRKMIMGEHLPLSILAGIALWAGMRGLSGRAWRSALAVSILLLTITNVRFLGRDIESFQANRAQSGIQRTYLYTGEAQALEWIRAHAPAGAPIQPLPWIRAVEGRIAFIDTTVAAFAPGLTGHPVNAGHWGETPDFGRTMGRWRAFLLPNTSDFERIDLLKASGVRYLVFSQKHDETADPFTENTMLASFRAHTPPYLRLIPDASNADADVYEVRRI